MIKKRDRWGGRPAFIMAAVGSAVGLGNIWRFPYIAYQNGGGAFLVPYFVAILVAGIPLLILEYGIGQRYQAGAPTALAKIHPWFRWVGWFAMLIGLSIAFYYCTVMAYSWKYMLGSVTMAWRHPVSSRHVLNKPYVIMLTGTEAEEAELRDQTAKKRKSIEGGCCEIYCTKDKLSEHESGLKSNWGENTVVLRTPGDVMEYAEQCLRGPPDDGNVIAHVAFMPLDDLIISQNQLKALYREVENGRVEQFFFEHWELRNLEIKIKDEEGNVKRSETAEVYLSHKDVVPASVQRLENLGSTIKPNEPFNLPADRKINLISEDKTTGIYFKKVTLGGFDSDGWKATHGLNQELAAHVKVLNSDGFAFDCLNGTVIAKLSPNALLAYGGLAEIWSKIKVAETAEEKKSLRAQLDGAKAELVTVLEAAKNSRSGEIWTPVWSLIFWAFVTWLAIFLIIFKGVKSVGKVVMITVPGPIIILTILIIHGLTLNGAGQGIRFFLEPNWNMLAKWEVWSAAFGQIFFSLSIGFGIMIAYASYQPKNSDVSNNAFMTTFCNCATSFYGAFAVFSVLGYLAVATNMPVKDVLSSGPGLVFVTYPLALMKMGMAGRVIGFLFFLCLLMLGIDSAFSIVEAVITGVHDTYKKISRELLTLIICGAGFLFSCMYCFKSGMMWLDIVDHWMSEFALMIVGVLECIAIAYFAKDGLKSMRTYINKKSEIQLGSWWDTFIKYVIPAILLALIGSRLIADAKTGGSFHGYDKVYWWSVILVGWGYFLVLFLVAFALSRNWTAFGAIVAAAVITVILYGLLGNLGAAAMGALGFMFLFGGFLWCLRRALQAQKTPEAGDAA